MGFWFFMLAMVLLIPLSMLFLGRYFIRHSPTKINYVFGYRTRMSMKIRTHGSLHTATLERHGTSAALCSRR